MTNQTSTAQFARQALEQILSATEIGIDSASAHTHLAAAGALTNASYQAADLDEEMEVALALHTSVLRLKQMHRNRAGCQS